MKKIVALSVLLIHLSINSKAQDKEPLFSPLPSDQTQINFSNTLSESVDLNIITYEYFYNGGGVAAGDINNDGLIDLYFTGNMVSNKLYLNKGNMVFEDITRQAGVGGHPGWKTGVTMADVNGDGLLDIYVCYSGSGDSVARRNQLFINNGNLKFKDEARQYGLDLPDYSTQAAFFDYDLDGDLDVYLLNHNIKTLRRFDASAMKFLRDPYAGDKLLRNDNGHFVDVSEKANIKGNPLGFGLGIAIADFNKDGWPDLYVSNDYSEQDYLYINNGNGTFTDKLEKEMRHISNFSMGSDAADFNNDGWVDLFTLDMLPEDNVRQKLLFVPDNYENYQNMLDNGFYHQVMRNMLQLNNGDNTFSEIGQLAGISNTDWSWAGLFADFDNDGYKDLFVTNGYERDMINMDFTKFYADERLKVSKGEHNERILQMLKQVPSTPLHNYIFRNNGDLTFTDESAKWGFDGKNFTNGAAYADLDNDGDLDLVINRLNESAVIYQNNSERSVNHIDFSFSNPQSHNRFGIGATVTLYSKGLQQYQEFNPSRGFQSAMHVPLHFGLNETEADSAKIVWPDGKTQWLYHVAADQAITVNYGTANEVTILSQKNLLKKIFLPDHTLLQYVNEEADHNDFKRQPLMPNMISYCGPRIASADINGDGLNDLYFCGTDQQAGKLFIQTSQGNFLESIQPAFENDSSFNDTDAQFFDADGDGDQDLYVVSGGYNINADDTLLQDRLYFNEGGIFYKRKNALPAEWSSGSCVRAVDFDGDGDSDLFIGGRVVPGRYPELPKSFILINDGKGNFKDATENICSAISNIGLVTDACWIDLNADGKPDLVIAGEWMQLKFFINTGGQLSDKSHQYLKTPSEGWWNRLYAADFDNDGDLDLVGGNIGLNCQVKVSEQHAALMFYNDFDNNGSVDPFIFCYIQDSLCPLAARDEALDQVISLRKKFTSYDKYAHASLRDILSDDQISNSQKMKAVRFETSYLENHGDHFEFKPLPIEAQFAPVFAIASTDYDGDGNKDLVLAGNMQHARIRFGKYDANYGILLKGDGKGNFSYVPQTVSGLSLPGDVRDIVPLKNASGNYLLFGINQQQAETYKLNPK